MNGVLDLFGNTKIETPKTEGIKYAGSKLKLLPSILDVVSKLEVNNVLDGFSSATKAEHFK
jgi:adenine-specific DNA-methyltransferase